MNTTMRTRLFSLFLNLVMFVSFNLGMNNSYAQIAGVDETCENSDPSATGGAYIYKPGCKFEESKTEITNWTPDTYNRIVSALFSIVAVMYIKFDYLKPSNADCSENKAANVTIRAIQASALTYLAGEIQANMRFKAAQKEAMDLAFTGIKTDIKVENNKQVEAFNQLIKLYEKQLGALDTKNILTGTAEAGFLAAEGVELANIFKCNSLCKVGYNRTKYASEAFQKTLETASNAAEAACNAEKCVGVQAAAGCPSLCSASAVALKTSVNSFLTKAKTDLQVSLGNAAVKESKASTLWYAPLLGITKLVNSGAELVNEPANLSNRMDDYSKGITSQVAKETSYKALKKAIDSQAKICSSITSSAVESATKGIVDALTKKGNINCCGTAGAGDNNSSFMLGDASSKSRFAVSKDIEFKPLLGDGIFGKGASIQSKDARDLIKTIVYNILFEKSFLNFKYDGNPERAIGKIAKFDAKIEEAIEYLEQNESDLLDEKADLLANAVLDSKDFYNVFKSVVSETSNFILPKAQATSFTSVLGFAGGIVLLGKSLEKIYKNWAGVTPKSRAIYWGLMAGVNGYTLAKDIKNRKKIKEYKEAIEKEREKFINAASGNTSLEEGGLGADTLNLKAGNYEVGTRGLGNYPGCIAATGSSYGPVKCPSLLRRDQVQIPKVSDRTRGLVSNAHVNTLGSLSDVAFNAANGSYLDNPNLLSGQLASASNNSNAMRKANAKLRDEIDKAEAAGPVLKDKNGKSFKPRTLASLHEQMMNSLGGSGVQPLSTEDIASSEETIEEEKKVAAIPKGTSLQTGSAQTSDFSIDLGLDEEKEMNFDNGQASGEQKLEDFVVEQNDISKKTEVSIFKILSNRYLLSYPKVLEEKKK